MIGIIIETKIWTFQVGVVGPENWSHIPTFRETSVEGHTAIFTCFLIFGAVYYEETAPTQQELFAI